VIDTTPELSPQDCLVAVMVAVSASDETMRTSELVTIERIVNHLPVFGGYDQSRITDVSKMVIELFSDEEGLDTLFRRLRTFLPEKMNETAYALACDVAAADGTARESELQLLEEMRYELNIDHLHAAAIERAARVRHKVL
jgi:tellurite resistance protein